MQYLFERIKCCFAPKSRLILSLLAFLSLVAALVSLFFPSHVANYENVNNKRTGTVGEIIDGRVIEQHFTANKNELCGLYMTFATYARENVGGRLFISVTDRVSGTEIANFEVEVQDISDGQEIDFMFPTQYESLGRGYVITITSDGCQPGNAVTIWTGGRARDTAYLTTDGVRNEEGILNFSLSYYVDDYPYTWGLLLISGVAFTLFGTTPASRLRIRKGEKA